MKKLLRRGRQEAPETDELVAQVRALARPLDTDNDLDPLLDQIGTARYVLLGEASHGTAEYYTWRTRISRRLITEKGFSFIAVEGDWPDCARVNQYVKGASPAGSNARDVLHAFERWPTWMWANEEIVALAEWLRRHNDGRPDDEKDGFYGLDVYSMWDSLYQVMAFLQRVDPAALPAARRAYQCFEPYGEDVQEYARATRWLPTTCEDEVVDLLQELRRQAAAGRTDGPEASFQADQNALVVKNAEAYYRAMVRGGPDSWNIRDRHMTETLERLMKHHGPRAKAIVWEHNTHIGDARFTDMAEDGMVNVGQLVRERHADEGVVLIGFGSHHGSVIAGREWDAPPECMPLPTAHPDTWEDVLHRAGADNKLLLFGAAEPAPVLLTTRGHRAVGVVYHPEYERLGNYVPTVLPRRYDAFLYLDETEGLHPLHVEAREEGEVPETFPSGV